MENIMLVLLVVVLFITVGTLVFLFKVLSEIKGENKQLKNSLKDYAQKSENENRILRKELNSIGSKISELTEIDKME